MEKKKLFSSLLMVSMLSLVGCNDDESTSLAKSEQSSTDIDESSSIDNDELKSSDFTFNSTYNPTTFDVSTLKASKCELADGVELYNVSYDLLGYGNDSKVNPLFISVDLNKANVVAGSYNNTHGSDYTIKSTPISMAMAYERDNPDSKVLATSNADFFGWGDDIPCCNAFVKDGVILKDSHNQDLNDTPASKPMLFGIKNKKAKIAPMTIYDDYEDNLAGAISDTNILSITSNGVNIANVGFESELARLTNVKQIGIVREANEKYLVNANKTSAIYRFEVFSEDDESFKAEIKESIKVEAFKCNGGNEGYLILGNSCGIESLKIGDSFEAAKYGPWHGYETVIGCRHSIIENGAFAPTLELEGKGKYEEYGNGTANRNPRSCLGILGDGKVILLSVGDLHYGNSKTYPICSGMNITQVADFMLYIGCVSAANLDGGGSTQLCTKSKYNGLGDYVTRVQSSDAETLDPNDSRKVLNSVLIVR